MIEADEVTKLEQTFVGGFFLRRNFLSGSIGGGISGSLMPRAAMNFLIASPTGFFNPLADVGLEPCARKNWTCS